MYEKTPVRKSRRGMWRFFAFILAISVLVGLGVLGYKLFLQETPEEAVQRVLFNETVAQNEQDLIQRKIVESGALYSGEITTSISTALESTPDQKNITIYVPVTKLFSPLQGIHTTDITIDTIYYYPEGTDTRIVEAIEKAFGGEAAPSLQAVADIKDTLDVNQVGFIPLEELDNSMKLISINDAYYLDSFTGGAVFRSVLFTGDDVAGLSQLTFRDFANSESTLKVNMTGVTALTRVMLRKLQAVQDPLYFSQFIGEFLSDADITHTTNEVSFQENCQYNNTRFCSDPAFLETLKASGFNLIDLSGNHNNDFGHELNNETITLYESLGWQFIGGGRNKEEAEKPFITTQKGSTVAILSYNYPDSTGVLASTTTAGANGFESVEKVAADITAAKTQADFVIVNVHYWECYAYPDGYVEYPLCDSPIQNQAEIFRSVADSGADLVVGTSAHQPQTYEIHNGVPIYYGLGNIYFEQTSWPGTERSLVLTHYFQDGKLIQTKVTPTVYGTELQTRLMDEQEAGYLLTRLYDAHLAL